MVNQQTGKSSENVIAFEELSQVINNNCND